MPFLNLTDQQKDLLRTLVSNYEAGAAVFWFTRGGAAGISYPRGVPPSVLCDEMDLEQLRQSGFISLTRISETTSQGKPTQLGITTVRDGLVVAQNDRGRDVEVAEQTEKLRSSQEDKDPFPRRSDQRPLGDNPFPSDHPAYEPFEEATWKAKTSIAKFKLELLRANHHTSTEFVQHALTYRKRWFTTCAFEATLIVGNEKTADWYEHWIDETASFILEDTLSALQRGYPNANPTDPSFLSPGDLVYAENDLKFELMKMVTHYKGVAASRVTEVFGFRKARRETTPNRTGDDSGTAKTEVTSEDVPTVADIEAALNDGDRKKAVELRCRLDGCKVNELWRSAFLSRRGTDATKQTAFNRWQASRENAPSWADALMRTRLLKP